jgi:aspartate kinase
MKIRAVRITDGTLPVLSCQSGITQIKLLANHPFSGQEIQAIFQMIANHQISLQRINLHLDQIVFSVPCAAADSITFLFDKPDYVINRNSNCAEINISGGQISDIPEIMAKIIETLSCANVSILQLSTSQAFVSVLIEQADLAKASSVIRAALSRMH